jgi:hypothetical protein
MRRKFDVRKKAVVQEAIETLIQVDVTIQVNTALAIDGVQTNIITCKGPLGKAYRLTHKGDRVDNLLALGHVPMDNLVIGTMPFPAFDTKSGQQGQRIVGQPNVMNLLGYHNLYIEND